MDQQKSTTKSKNTILKFLPRATSSVTFQNPHIFSPSKDKRSSDQKLYKSHLGIGFSGPMVSMIPSDTRRKNKNNSDDTYEPTSPRVSCMGQVKCKYTRAGNKPPTRVKKVLQITSGTLDGPDKVQDGQVEVLKTESKGKKKLGFKKLFGGVITTPGPRKAHRSGRKSDAEKKKSMGPLYLDKAPSLGTMKRFSSGRDKFSNIVWTKEVAMRETGNHGNDSDEESDDEHVIVPSSAPVMIRNSLGFDDKFVRVGAINMEPRKEINLWKRRTMQQPKPLLLNNN